MVRLSTLLFALVIIVSAVTGVSAALAAPALANLTADTLIHFQTGGQDVAHDINVADNRGGLRLYGCPQLTLPPQCAAIQFFGNGSSGFPGQVYIDSGAHNSAAILFRTTDGQGNVFERMRIVASTGFIGVFTTTPQAPFDVVGPNAHDGPAIRGQNTSFSGGIGVTGITRDIYGVEGSATLGGTGVFGHSNSGIGVRGTSTSGYAGKFEGNVIITGEIRDSGGTCYSHCSPSDERLKKDIQPLNPVLASLSALQPVQFAWRTDEFPDRSFSAGPGLGLIAQDVEQVFPDLVFDTDRGYRGVRYERLPVLLLQGLKDVTAEKQALEERVATLEEQNATLESRLAAIEQLLNGGSVPLVAAR